MKSDKRSYDGEKAWDIFGPTPGATPSPPPTTNEDDPKLRPVLRRGSRGEAVKTVQRCLDLDLVDGIFGPVTERAVKGFQATERIRVDGIVGANTWGKLDEIEQIRVPLDYDEPRPLSSP